MIPIQQQGDSVTFSIRVHPKARRERITGIVGDSLKLELTAPPVQNKANKACIRFFAELLKVPRSSVTIAANPGSRNKVIRISGVATATVKQAVAAALGL